jgi:general secretion pathway protein D
VLAGLISDDDRHIADKVPGLGDMPVVGRLFKHTTDNKNRSEIVLLITPRLVRTLARPDAGSVEFAAGTEASTGTPRLGAAPLSIPSIPPPPPQPGEGEPAAPPPPTTSPATPGIPLIVPFGGVKPSPAQ